MGRIDSLVLYQYNHHHERSAEDNAVFWFETFFKEAHYPGYENLPRMTVFQYNPYDIYYQLCEFGLSATKKGRNDDVFRQAFQHTEKLDDWFIDTMIYERGDYLNAYRLYYNNKNKYGMAKCNYKLHNYNEAFSNLNEAIIECIDKSYTILLPERLSLLSSAYRYGRGVEKDEVYADKLLELSKIIEKESSSKYELYYKSKVKVITGIKIEYKDGKTLFFEK